MATAKRGDTVRLHYTGRLSDGTVFDTTENAQTTATIGNFDGKGVAFAPAEVVIGGGEFPPDFEEALVGLEPGQAITISIPPERAFGAWSEERVAQLSLDDFAPRELGLERFRVAEGRHRPNKFDPKVGDDWEVTLPDGAQVRARVVAKTDETITLDANHPLAGRDLIFDIRLLEILPLAAPPPADAAAGSGARPW